VVTVQPSIVGKIASGIHYATFLFITTVEADIRKDPYFNVELSGGTTMYIGNGERITMEQAALSRRPQRKPCVTPPVCSAP
jgi:actin-related protein